DRAEGAAHHVDRRQPEEQLPAAVGLGTRRELPRRYRPRRDVQRGCAAEEVPPGKRAPAHRARIGIAFRFLAGGYFAEPGNAGSFATSRASCWMMTVALRFAAIFLKRSIEASDSARSVLKTGTPALS